MSECRCGRPTRDEAYVCETCGDSLTDNLRKIPDLDAELEVTASRQQGVDYRRNGGGKGPKKPAETPTPVHWGASEARTHLKALLVSWALFCDAEGVRSRSHDRDLPADDTTALALWFVNRVDALMFHDIAPEAVAEIDEAVRRCERVIDRPVERQYLGECAEQGCAGRMYGKPGAAIATCDTCATTQDADAIRAELLASLDDRLCTAAEIARLSTYLGLKADRSGVRKRINQWHVRGLIEGHEMPEGKAFRFGIVYAMLAKDEYRAA